MKNVLGVFCNYAKNDRGKKIIIAGIALATINKFCPETANSAETIKQMPNTTLVECLLTSKSPNSAKATSALEAAKIQAPTNSFQDIFIPLQCGLGDDLSSEGNTQRALFYNINTIPEITVNGIYDNESLRSRWIENILPGIENQKNWAKFEMIPKGSNKYTLKVQGIDMQLNKLKNVYLNAVLIENVVNVNYPNTMSTIRNVVREYLFKDKKGKPSALGKLVVLSNGSTILSDIELNIPKDLENKYSVITWIQKNPENDKANINEDNTEILAAGSCRIVDSQILGFNWNNRPNNTVDEKIQKEYYIQQGLNEMNLNLVNAQNLKTMNFDFNKHDFRDKYRVVGVKPNPELFDITFDQRYNRTSIVFKKPINGNLENAITFIIDFKKQDDTSAGLRFCWLDIRDKDGKFPYVDMSGEPMRYGPNQLWISGFKPFDFNQDKRIDYADVNELTKHFGRNHKDSNWDPRYDTDKNNRVDIVDLVATIKAADTEATLRAQFHDNLKRLNIWETGIMPVCKIKSARYGYDDKWSDVTKLLQEKLEKGTFELHVMDENLGSNPYPGAFKYLQITYDDPEQKDFNIELEQFSTMKFKKECDSSQSTGKKDAKSYTHKDYLLYYQ
jgi:hypothetical protein